MPGIPYFSTFTPRDYPGEQQNRWVIQRHDKTMLFANSGGLLQHGDQHWRIFGGADITFLSALQQSAADTNIIWAGSFSNIGYFETTDSALFSYHSLTELLPDSLRDFSDVSEIVEFNESTFFLNDLYLFEYTPEDNQVNLPEIIYNETGEDTRITHITGWRDRLYVFLDNGSLLTLDANLQTNRISFEDGLSFSNIVATQKWGNQIILGDTRDGLLQFDGQRLSRFETVADDYLTEHLISDIAVFENANIAVSTDDGGTIILNGDGSLDALLAKKTGLRENIHNQLFIDHNEDLWIAGNESITKVYTGVPLRHLNGDVFGFGDAVQLHETDDEFYVGAMNGLYRYTDSKAAILESDPGDLFKKISPVSAPFWGFLQTGNGILTTSNSGVYRLEGRRLTKLFDKESFFPFAFTENKVLIVTSNGVEMIAPENGKWIDLGSLDVAEFYIYAFAVSNDTTFWAGGVQGQLIKAVYDRETNTFQQRTYTEADGLLASDAYEPVYLNGELIINSNKGYMVYDKAWDKLRSFDGLNRDLGNWGEYLNLDNAGNYWSVYIEDEYRGIVKMMPETDSTWKRVPTVFELSKDHFGDFIEIYDERIWVGSTESIMYRDLYEPLVSTLPEVTIWQVQSLFDQEILSLGALPEEIPFQQKQIQIDVMSSSYRYPEKNEYRYRIDDGNWSEWRSNPGIVIEKSLPGSYQLEVQTKDFMGQVSEPGLFGFSIIAPWYLSHLAFAGYGLLFIGGIFLSVRGLSNYRIRRELEQVKVKEAEKLIELDAMKSRLFANISHEFRTPLTISHGLVKKSLRERSDGKEISVTKRDMLLVNRNLNRLRDMVNQIIDLTKADHDHLKLDRNYYRSEELVTLSVESFRSLAEYRGHKYQVEQSTDNSVLFVDRSKVEIIINNLISNAIKFTRGAGHIRITSAVEKDVFRVTVSDTGPGIPQKDQDAIFERFYRIEQKDEEYVEGMGVGLELSRTLARLHDGELRLLPGTDHGATFELTLPVAKVDNSRPVINIEQADLQELAQDVPDDLQKTPKKKPTVQTFRKLLLVEDNEDMMDYVRGVLSHVANIKTAGNGKEAIDQIKNSPPDLIITDLMMPQMDGMTLIGELQKNKRWKDIPVIVLTAKAIDEQKTDLLRIGVVDYITKPFEPDQLMLKVRNLLTYAERRMEVPEPDETDLPETESLKEQVVAYIQKHISDSELSVDQLVSVFPQSRRSFYRNIQRSTGMTPSELIREMRFKTAERLTQSDKKFTLEELADAVGYKSATSFRKAFEKSYGKHPLN